MTKSKKRWIKWAALLVLALVLTGVGFRKIPKAYSKYQFSKMERIDKIFVDPNFPSAELFEVPEGVRHVTMFAIGDVGTGAENQFRVGALMNRIAAEAKPSCVLMLGDNFYPDGVTSVDDPQWETAFEKPYAGEHLQIPFYVCLGNHDHKGSTDAQIARTALNTRWKLPAIHHSFIPDETVADLVTVISIDTTPLSKKLIGPLSYYGEIERLLSESKSKWKIVMGHHPMQSAGRPSYHGGKIKGKILDLLLKYDVDLYISGHDHHMEMGSIDDILPYAVLGSGAQVREPIVVIPSMYFAAASLGFGKIRVLDERIVLDFIGLDGETLYSRALLKKN